MQNFNSSIKTYNKYIYCEQCNSKRFKHSVYTNSSYRNNGFNNSRYDNNYCNLNRLNNSHLINNLINSCAINKHSIFKPINEQSWSHDDIGFMQLALELAKEGAKMQEVPVGAVLVHDNMVIGKGFNRPIGLSDPTAHAEVVALREACLGLSNYRLPENTTLYVTLEPCTMCVGALIHARVSKIIFATNEPRAGMLGSQMNLSDNTFYNHKIEVQSGLLAPQSSQMLKDFFKQRRSGRVKSDIK